jgi:YidC/Oxa1 family membrane protein insertase
MINLLLGEIVFPTNGDWIAQAVYGMLKWITSWPWLASYGAAIMIFALFIKLIFSPLDFISKYFTKKNQVMMQKLAPEEANLRKTYANDPMALNRARQELYAKNGGGQGGLCLVTLIHLIVAFTVFMSVFNALRTVANNNINAQVNELQGVYDDYKEGGVNWAGEDVLKEKLNEMYGRTNVRFLWVNNIWQPDTLWAGQTLSYRDFKSAIGDANVDNKSQIEEADYNAMMGYINETHKGGNGWLLLVLLAGGTTFFSVWLTAFITRKQQPQKVGTKQEPIITYSLRDARAKNYGGEEQPAVDPAMMNKMMMYIMPVIMVLFAVSSTAAMAIYIISSSVVSTGLSLLCGFAVDWIIKNQKPKDKKGDAFDPTIINPHAKYFKR